MELLPSLKDWVVVSMSMSLVEVTAISRTQQQQQLESSAKRNAMKSSRIKRTEWVSNHSKNHQARSNHNKWFSEDCAPTAMIKKTLERLIRRRHSHHNNNSKTTWRVYRCEASMLDWLTLTHNMRIYSSRRNRWASSNRITIVIKLAKV